MESNQGQRAVAAAMSTASAFGLAVDDAVILNDSNRLVVRLTPCDTVARVTPTTHHAGHQMSPEREVDVVDRIAAVQQDVASPDVTPDLTATDRDFLASMLRDLSRSIASRHAPEQLLHGQPHLGNVLRTKNGPLFIDFENTAIGPVEYDLGWVSREVGDRYAGADQDLVDECRASMAGYSSVWLCMAGYSSVWLAIAAYGWVWLGAEIRLRGRSARRILGRA